MNYKRLGCDVSPNVILGEYQIFEIELYNDFIQYFVLVKAYFREKCVNKGGNT